MCSERPASPPCPPSPGCAQDLLLFYALTVVVALAAVGFVVIALATRSVRLAFVCMLTILNVVGSFTGFMVGVFGMEPGMIESVVLMVSVGIMLDPLTHVAHAFNEACGSRAQRLAHGLTTIGISVLAGALSTAGSCLFLLCCTINLFSQFGRLLCTLLVVTILYTNTFLAPLLLLVGPGDDAGACAPCLGRKAQGRRSTGVWRQFDVGDGVGDGGKRLPGGGSSMSGIEF